MNELDALVHQLVEPVAEDRMRVPAADLHDVDRLRPGRTQRLGLVGNGGEQSFGGNGVAELGGELHGRCSKAASPSAIC